MSIDPAPLWANLFLYQYENEYISELILNDKVKAHHFHATKRFIDDLGTLNDVCIQSCLQRHVSTQNYS